jgi:pimeloyl-ACP methyl ester carboxylesterase
MSTILIMLLLVGVIVATSVVLGRTTHEVESARDTEYLELEGTWIRYNVIGGGPPVLLVHGWLSSSRIWEHLAARLAQRFTVYTLDLSGFGDSDKPLSGYGVRTGSRLLYAFCAHFGLTRTSIIAHDLGGNMAVKLAADHPDMVGRLVLVATPADEDQIDLPTPLWLATLPVLGPLFYTLGRLMRPLRMLWMRPFVADPHDLTEEVIDDAGRSTPAAVAGTLSVARREISRGRLARQARIIKIPLLLIAGEEDQIVDPQAVGAWARSVDLGEVYLLHACGHLPMIERTAEFNARILAFLTGDVRYLDQIKAATPHEEAAEDPEAAAPLAEGEALQDEDAVIAEREEPPNIIRKRGGRYPARSHEPESPALSFDNGAEREWPRGGLRREPREDVIPQLPDDLFNWPEVPAPYRPRATPPGDREDGPDDYSEEPQPPP